MSRLLRFLKKSFLESQSTRRYLLYSLGEFTLIVAGILVAMQINNWNEKRRNQKMEYYYLDQLIKEIDYNIKSAEYGISESQSQYNSAQLILAIIEEDTLITDAEQLAHAIEYTGWSQRVIYINNIWTDLNSTGNIALISNNILRNELADMQRGFDRTIYFNEKSNAFNLGFRRPAGDIIKGSVRFKLVQSKKDTCLSDIQGIDSAPYIQKALRERAGLGSYLADIMITRNAMIENYQDDINKMQKILLMIKEQLN